MLTRGIKSLKQICIPPLERLPSILFDGMKGHLEALEQETSQQRGRLKGSSNACSPLRKVSLYATTDFPDFLGLLHY